MGQARLLEPVPGSTSHRAEWAWLPGCLLLLLAATLFPFQIVHCTGPPWSFGLNGSDLIANVLLFLPLGLVLGRRHPVLVLLGALALSGAVEIAQGWLPRQRSFVDVLGNVLGAATGLLLLRVLASELELPRVRAVLRVGAAIVIAATLLAAARLSVNDFSNWESFPLVVGNEATGDRPWSGTLAEFAIYDRALAGEAIERDRAGAPPLWEDGGPVLWVRLEEPPVARLDGPDGSEPAPELFSSHAGAPSGPHRFSKPWRLPDRFADHLYERLTTTGRLTIRARIRPESLEAYGPARILSFSLDPYQRNFTLAQQGPNVSFRVRTPTTGANGSEPEVETFGSPLTTREHWIEAAFDGQVSRIIVDASCQREVLIAMHGAPTLLGRMLGVTIVLCTALGGLAVASLARSGPHWLRLALLCGGGAGTWLVLWLGGTWEHMAGFGGRSAVLGALALAVSVPLLGAIAASSHPGPGTAE